MGSAVLAVFDKGLMSHHAGADGFRSFPYPQSAIENAPMATEASKLSDNEIENLTICSIIDTLLAAVTFRRDFQSFNATV
jgi:hypothetical protein